MAVAHKFSDKSRTNDVLISETVDFAGLLLSDSVLQGLKKSGFERPSPIQLKAIPLGRCGLDLIVQAKSGTGKTCVFSVIALESIEVKALSTQVLVLAPTREIAIQIWEVIGSLGSSMPDLQCHIFIGGLPLHEDKKKLQCCHIAVGTPGRIQNLIEQGCLKTDSIRLFVLDEADKLLEESFQDQINWIYSSLPDNKQMLALSATYPEYLAEHLTVYMRNPTYIRLNISDPTLLGIKQYYATVASHPLPHKVFEAKTAVVVDILSKVSFHQCLIFSNMQTRAQNLESELTSRGWPTTCIAGCLDQKDRITAMAKLKSYQCRVLISTDLTSRGIDADRVNLVINLDVPKDHETYLHRIGRAGRFGSYGAGVTIVSDGQELLDMHNIECKISTHILTLPDPIPVDLVKRQLEVHLDDVVSTEKLVTRSEPGQLLPISLSPAKVQGLEEAVSHPLLPTFDGGIVHTCADCDGDVEENNKVVMSESGQSDGMQCSTSVSARAEDKSKPGNLDEAIHDVGLSLETDVKNLAVKVQFASHPATQEEVKVETSSSRPEEQARFDQEKDNADGENVQLNNTNTLSNISDQMEKVPDNLILGTEKSAELCRENSRSSENSATAVVSEMPIVGQKDSKTHSMASIWSSMLTTEQFSDTAESPESSKSDSFSTDSTSVENQLPKLNGDLQDNSSEKGSSFGNELELYKTDRLTAKPPDASELANGQDSPAPPAVPKKASSRKGVSKAGDFWSSMLTSSQSTNTSDSLEVEGIMDSSLPDSTIIQPPKSDSRGKYLSFESELELYKAARSKVKGVKGDEAGSTDVNDVAKVADDRPKTRARRRLGAGGGQSDLTSQQQKEENACRQSQKENGQGKVGVHVPQLPYKTELELKQVISVPSDADGNSKNEKENSHGQDVQTSDRLLSQVPEQYRDTDGKPLVHIKEKNLSMPTAENKHCHDASLENKGTFILVADRALSVSSPKIPVFFRAQSEKDVIPFSYGAVLHDYKDYLLKNTQPNILSAIEMVHKTLKAPEKLEQSHLQQVSVFLSHFHKNLRVKRPKDEDSTRNDGSKAFPKAEKMTSKGDYGVCVNGNGSLSEAGVWDGGDNAQEGVNLDWLMPTSKSQSLLTRESQRLHTKDPIPAAGSKSLDTAAPGDKGVPSVNGIRETSTSTPVKNAPKTSKKSRRYKPMAVCTPATSHLFGFTAAQSGSDEPENALNGIASTGSRQEEADEVKNSHNSLQRPESPSHSSVSTPVSENQPGSAVEHSIIDKPDCVINRSPAICNDNSRISRQENSHTVTAVERNGCKYKTEAKGAIPKRNITLTEQKNVVSSPRDSSCESSSSSSTSTSDSSAEEGSEKRSMCYRNYHADENASKGRRKKPSTKTLNRTKVTEETIRRRSGRPPTTASSLTASKEQRTRTGERRDHDDRLKRLDEATYAVPNNTQHSWNPYSAQHSHYYRTSEDQTFSPFYHHYAKCYPDTLTSPSMFMHPSYFYHHTPTPKLGYPDYHYQHQRQAQSFHPQQYHNWQQYYQHGQQLQTSFSKPASCHCTDCVRLSAEKTARMQAEKAESLQKYFHKMAKFYGQLCKRDN